MSSLYGTALRIVLFLVHSAPTLLIGVPCILDVQFEAFQASEATWENKRFVVDRVMEQSLQVSSECNTELLEVRGMFLDNSQRGMLRLYHW